MAVSKSPLIMGVGELLWDMLPTGKVVGGAPVNFVYHATKLGARGVAVSAIGTDVLGNELLNNWIKTASNIVYPVRLIRPAQLKSL